MIEIYIINLVLLFSHLLFFRLFIFNHTMSTARRLFHNDSCDNERSEMNITSDAYEEFKKERSANICMIKNWSDKKLRDYFNLAIVNHDRALFKAIHHILY